MSLNQMIDFQEAKILSMQLIDFFNSPESDSTLKFIADRFNLTIRDPVPKIEVSGIYQNCPECMGCRDGTCTAGCYITNSRKLCYWGTALNRILGERLVFHEIGHVVYEQVFVSNLDPQMDFNKSELVAMYFETHRSVILQNAQNFVTGY